MQQTKFFKCKLFKVNKGFLLLEIMVSLFLFTVFSLLIFNFLDLHLIKKSDFCSDKYLAYDLLRRDLMQAEEVFPYRIQDLFLRSDSNLFVYWKKKKDKLVRIEGNYDFSKKLWINKIQSIVAQKVQDFKINYIQNRKGRIELVHINIWGDKITVRLRNRVLV